MSFKLVMEHHESGMRVLDFGDDYEAAAAYGQATNPERDGSLMPNVSDEILNQFGGDGSENYSRGLFWLGNRYAVIFNTDPKGI